MKHEALVDAAGLVADGDEFDLASISSSLVSDEERAVADELAVVARIAAAHRKFHQVLPADAPGTERAPFASSWGHLDLIEVVGRGSYGTVYRAWDPRLDRLVALKLFHGARNPEAVMREGRMLARIRHENVVTVHGADVFNGIAGIWMEFVQGKRLDQIVEQQGPLSADEATLAGLAVCRALAAVHDAGLVHCDVKAQNVIREPGGRIVLMDFGAGRSTKPDDDSTSRLQVAGTPRYMAPEVFDHGSAIPQSDVYSVGVLLFYLVSGRFPVDGKTLSEIRKAHLEDQRVKLGDVRADLPAEFLRDVTRALDPNPFARHATAGELEAGLLGIQSPGTQTVTMPASRRGIQWIGVAALLVASLIAGLGWRVGRNAPAPPVATAGTRTIAVLPIKNLTGDASKAYLADGLTEVFISNFARVRTFRVPSSGAVAAFREKSEPSADVGKKLGVELLMAGAILNVGDRTRIDVQLIEAASDRVLWSHELTPEAGDLLSVPAEVARLVARRLSIGLSPDENLALTHVRRDPRAEDAFLRGLVDASSKLDTGIPAAARHFHEATQLEPDYAAAWAQWAMIELRMAQFVALDQRGERVKTARTLAARSLTIDAKSPAGLVALGTAQFYYDWDFRAAEASYRAALEIEPSSVLAQQYLSGLLAATNRLDDAIAVAQESVRLEPLVPTRHTNLGIMYYYNREYDRALEQMQNALRVAPGFPLAFFGMGRIHAAGGRYAEAAESIEHALAGGRNMAWLPELGCVYAAAGRPDDLRRIQTELEERGRGGEHASLDHVAHVAAAEGRLDEGFRALRQAVAARDPNVLWLRVDPRLDAFRTHPGYIDLLKQAGLQ